MSYLVLARKYRPQTFAEIVGQEHVTRTLANAFARGRVHHAFLFCGARGVGKTTAARVLAKALCCANGPTATPCGVCDPCVTITNGTAVDYFEIDGASNNGVDDIRELRDGVRYQPAQLRRKIYVIDEVHMLSVAAFNALLKTLEEPPAHVTFIFATTEVHKIPVTILSRCQRYDFKLVPTTVLRGHLEGILGAEKIAVDKGALALLAREAGGSVRDALSLTDQVIAYTGGEPVTEARAAEVLGVADRGLLRQLLGAVLGGDPKSAILAVDAAMGRGVDMSHLARSFLGALRDAAVVQSIADAEGLVDGAAEEIAALRELVKNVPRPHLLAMFDRFAKACEELRDSPSPRLLVEVALLDMASREPLAPIAELVERLEQLEGRLAKGGSGGGAKKPSTSASPSAPTVTKAPPPGPSPAPTVTKPPAPSPAPAPPSPSPAAPTPRAPYRVPSDTMAAWATLIDAIEARSKKLAGIYHTARLISWTDRAIELGATGSMASDPENIKQLKQIVAEIVGAPLDVKVTAEVAAAPAARSLSELEAERKETERLKNEQEARAHPLTEKVIETFGAQIKEIKEIKFDG